MVEISFTIPDEKLQRVINGIKVAYPIPLDEKAENPIYTNNEWARKVIKNFVINAVFKAERDLVEKEVERDESLIN